MTTEFKLSYTGSQINEKLGKVDILDERITDIMELQIPLDKNTNEFTPLDAFEAVTDGTSFFIAHDDPTWGRFVFSNFVVYAELEMLASYAIFSYEGYIYNASLFGNVSSGQWEFSVTQLQNHTVELDTTLTAQGKAADAKAVGDALNGKLSKTGGTVTGKIVFPTGDQNVGFANSQDMKIFGYGSVDGTMHMRIGDTQYPFQIRGNGDRPKYNNDELALKGEIPDVSGYVLKSSAETWTFTLADNSTVTKKVVLA